MFVLCRTQTDGDRIRELQASTLQLEFRQSSKQSFDAMITLRDAGITNSPTLGILKELSDKI